MNREQAALIIGQLSDRHVAAAAQYAPGAGVVTPERHGIEKTHRIRRPVLIAAVLALVFALGVTAYATDLVGFRQTVRVWFRAERQQAELWDTGRDGVYALVFPDGEKLVISGGKGSEDGTVIPMSAEELLSQMENNFDIQRDTDGRIWLCCRDEKREITDLFDENGTALLALQKGETTFRYQVKIKGGGFEFHMLNPLEDIAPLEDYLR